MVSDIPSPRTSSALMSSKPSSRESFQSPESKSEPRIPTWIEFSGKRSPSSTARLKGVPGIGVRVKLHEGQRSVHGGCGPQFRQGDRVVAAEHDGNDARAVYGLESSAIL